MRLGEKISSLRKQRGMTQMELAEKLDVSRQAVSRWENGSALPSMSNLTAIGKLFDVSVDILTDASSPIEYKRQGGESKGTYEKANRINTDRVVYFMGHIMLPVIVSVVTVCFMLGINKNTEVNFEGGGKVPGQEENIESKEEIIYSESWSADGMEVYIIRRDGTTEKVPEFSELFPGWNIPKAEAEQAMDQTAYYIDNTN